MKIDKNFMKVSSVVLLMLTVLPLFLEMGRSALPVMLITVGSLGSLWAMAMLYEEARL